MRPYADVRILFLHFLSFVRINYIIDILAHHILYIVCLNDISDIFLLYLFIKRFPLYCRVGELFLCHSARVSKLLILSQTLYKLKILFFQVILFHSDLFEIGIFFKQLRQTPCLFQYAGIHSSEFLRIRFMHFAMAACCLLYRIRYELGKMLLASGFIFKECFLCFFARGLKCIFYYYIPGLTTRRITVEYISRVLVFSVSDRYFMRDVGRKPCI